MIATGNPASALTAFGPQMTAILQFVGAATPPTYRDCIDTVRTVAGLRGIELGLPNPDEVDSNTAVRQAVRGSVPRFRESFDRGLREMTTSGDILRATIRAQFNELDLYALYRNGLVTREIAMSFLNSLAHRYSKEARMWRTDLATEMGLNPRLELEVGKRAARVTLLGIWSAIALNLSGFCHLPLALGLMGIAIMIPPMAKGIATLFQDQRLMRSTLPPDSWAAELRDRVRIIKEDTTSLRREADRIATSWL